MPKIYEASETYSPIEAGSIDGTDTTPHDHGLVRAMNANYNPKKDYKINTRPECTLYVGRLNKITTEKELSQYFEQFGKIHYVRVVKDIITGLSRGYAFVEFKHSSDCRKAYRTARNVTIDGKRVLIDIERERSMQNWVPRRFGGGLGGKKESGQLRFGGPDRPHKLPYTSTQRK